MPATAFAEKTADEARPEAFVVAVVTPPAKLPEAPLDGAANVTTAPVTGLPPEFVTPTTSAPPKAVFTEALCGDPLETKTCEGTEVTCTVRLAAA